MTAPATDPAAVADVPTINVQGCTKCGKDHEGLECWPISNDDRQALKLAPELTHRAVCPETGQAIYGAVPVPVKVTFPMFDVWAWRRQGLRIHGASDKTLSPAVIKDVIAVSEYARTVASIAAIEVMNIGQGAMQQLLEQRLAQTVEALSPVIDLAISRAITGYDDWRKVEDTRREREIRDRVWWRRLLRWARAKAPQAAKPISLNAIAQPERNLQPPAEAR